MSSRLEALLTELDAQIRALEDLPYPQVREQMMQVLQLIDGVHRPGLAALSSTLHQAGVWEQALEDESIHLLFTLYELAPMDERAQAELALESIRPYVRSHGGEVEVLKVEGGEVHVRLRGTCGTCAASAMTLERGVRTALQEGFPGFRQLIAFAPPPPDGPPSDGLVQLHGPEFCAVAAFDALVDRRPTTVERQGQRVLVLRVDDQVYAYDPACPACAAPFEDGKISGHVLLCPYENCAFDVRSGRRIDGTAGDGLRTFPVTVRDGQVLLATALVPAALFVADAER